MTIQLGTLMVELGPAGTGVNQAVRGIVRTHAGEVEAFVKRLDNPREMLVEAACADLARSLSLPVPEPIIVFVPEYLGGPGLAFGSKAIGAQNVGAFLDAGYHPVVMSRLRAWKHLVPAACFDEWITNCDRHPRNLLFNGYDDFWLIDHGLAVHPQLPVDGLSPANQLFAIAVDGLSEGDLLMLRPKALKTMKEYASAVVAALKGDLPANVWSAETIEPVFAWLEARQDHLVRLGSERIPARQSEMFDGRQA